MNNIMPLEARSVVALDIPSLRIITAFEPEYKFDVTRFTEKTTLVVLEGIAAVQPVLCYTRNAGDMEYLLVDSVPRFKSPFEFMFRREPGQLNITSYFLRIEYAVDSTVVSLEFATEEKAEHARAAIVKALKNG